MTTPPLVGIVTLGGDGSIEEADVEFCRMLGHDHPANLNGKALNTAMAVPSQAEWALKGGVAGESMDVLLRRADGGSAHAIAVRLTEHALPGEGFKLMMVSVTEPKRDAQLSHLGSALKTWVAVIDALPSSIALLDAGGRVTSLNGMWRRMLADNAANDEKPRAGDETEAALQALAPGEPYAEGCRRIGILSPEDAIAVADGIQMVTMGTTDVFSLEVQLANRDRWHRIEVVPLDRENFDGSVVIHTDLTERHRLHADLSRHATQLAEANSELQQFASIVSHDLKEPLRNVVSYLQLLARRYRGQLGQDADDFIDFAVKGAKQMARLLNDLLTYNRLTRDTRSPGRLDLSQLVESVLAGLHQAIIEADAEIVVEPLPAIIGDEVQVVSVFQNLIGNALKYHAPGRRPRILIRAESDCECWLFTVADNGLGIEEEYHEKIFHMFQRLHTQEEYDGSGIGLAIAKRVVESHGGAIWLDSLPGKGTEFHFTWPKTPNQN